MNKNISFSGSSESHRDSADLEKRWIREIRKGKKEAFKEVFECYYDQLLRFAYRYLESRDEAEGVVQNVFLWVWENRKTWRVDGSLKTYLYRSVKYKALDILRHEDVKDKYEQELSLQKEEREYNNIEKKMDDKKLAETVRNAIENLPERARRIYKLSRLEGLTYNEIAYVMEISPKTVESQMSRALKILRKQLSGYLGVLFVVNLSSLLV